MGFNPALTKGQVNVIIPVRERTIRAVSNVKQLVSDRYLFCYL